MGIARVSAAQVKEIIETDIDDDILLSNFIDTAHIYVDTHLSAAGHDSHILTKIELYLAAHFVAITDEGGALKYTKLGDASDAYDTSFLDSGLKSTRYGQTALTLDSSGILANVGTASLKAEFRVI